MQSPNGATHEVQILPKEVAAIAEDTHELYEQARDGDKEARADLQQQNAAAMEEFNARNAGAPSKTGDVAPATRFAARQTKDGEWGVFDHDRDAFVRTADDQADAETKAAVATHRDLVANGETRSTAELGELTKPKTGQLKLTKGTQVLLPDGRLAKVDFHDHGRTNNTRLTLPGPDGGKMDSVPGSLLAPIQPLTVRLHDTGTPLEKSLEKRVETHAPQMISDFLRKNTEEPYGVPTISVDLAKLQFPEYRADPVGMEEQARGSAVALAEAAWRTALARPVDYGRPYVLLQTGSPASGKSTGLESIQHEVAIKRETLFSDPADARQMVEDVLDSGRRPVIAVTFLDDPAEQVRRMIQRALGDEKTKGIGRVVPIRLMADTLVQVPKTVAKLEAEFGEKLGVHSVDNSGKPGEAKFYDGLSRAAENAAKWTKESALEVMRAELEKLRTTRNIPEDSYRRALGDAEGQQSNRPGDSGRDEQTPAPQASEGLEKNPLEKDLEKLREARAHPPPPRQRITVPPDLYKQITDAYSADKISEHNKKSTIRPPFEYEGDKWTTTSVTGSAQAESYRVIPLEANEGGLSYHASNSEERRRQPEGSYHGIEVSSRGKRFMMKGPPVTFVPGEAKPEVAAPAETQPKYVLPSFVTSQYAKPQTEKERETARRKAVGKARSEFTRLMTKRAKAADAATPATVSTDRPDLITYSGEVREFAGDANFERVAVQAENRRHAEQLLAEQYPGKHISEVDRFGAKQRVAAIAEEEENKPHTHDKPEDQTTRAPEDAEDVSGVSGPAGEGRGSPRAVQPEGAREDEGSRDAGLDAGRSDAVGLEHDVGSEEGGSTPERSGGSGEPGAVPARGGRSGLPVAAAQEALPRNTNNFHISDEYAARIGAGGEIAKIKGNLDALETLKKIQAEGRETATPEEQQTLAKYVDFGGLVGMLQNPYSPQYRAHYARFIGMLTQQEIQEIRETLPNTHYTSMQMVDWMWRAMQRMGFQGGRLLEPGMGIGNFLGRMPEEISKKAEIFGVERNPLTGAMAKLLYPDARITVKPFQQFLVPDNSLNAAIGNVPFQDVNVAGDPAYAKLKLSLHNYFIVKTLDKLKPGGIAAARLGVGTRQPASCRHHFMGYRLQD